MALAKATLNDMLKFTPLEFETEIQRRRFDVSQMEFETFGFVKNDDVFFVKIYSVGV